MKIINNTLFIEIAEMVACGVSERYLWKAKSTGTKCWSFINDPSDKRKVLIGYEDLKDNYKKAIQQRFGNPYDYVAKLPIKKLVETDFKAEDFFLEYKYDGDKKLDPDAVKKYTTAASWLNMICKLTEDKRIIKKELNLTVDQFWLNIYDLIKAEQVSLPTCYSKLNPKIKIYKEQGYSSLIHSNYGNKAAAKINDQNEAMLLEMIAHPNQFDDEYIARQYNLWAVNNDHKTITGATVGLHRKKNEFKLLGSRSGNSTWYQKYGKVVHRSRPSAPLLMLGSDDNDLDLYFMEITTDAQGHKQTNNYFRYKLIVVMDAYNDYILGYSFGDEVTIDLIKAAYLDAVYHIKELTGGWYLPHQVQTDRWGVDAKLTTRLAQFYQSLATYTPATVKLARSKYIERAFGHDWHQQLRRYPNYAGTNITSKTRLNRDNVELIKRNFPTKEEGIHQVEEFINNMRLLPNKENITRQQQWLDAFTASEKSKEKCIGEEKMLLLFGTPHIVPAHRYPEYPNQITNKGIEATINGRSFIYDVPEHLYLHNVGKRVQLIYEPYNYKRVLVTDGESLRFIATEFSKAPGALADFQEGDRTRLNTYLKEKLGHTLLIASERDKRQNSRMHAEGLLQAGVMIKGVKQQAEALYQQTFAPGSRELEMYKEDEAQANEDHLQYVRSKTDINQYLED